MSQAEQNAEIVRRAYEAFNTADMATLTELIELEDGRMTDGREIFADQYSWDAFWA
jgi:ketosteroid isomerase-like protein